LESIFNRLEQLVAKSKEASQADLTNGQKQLKENNSKTIEKLSELEKSNRRQLSSMNEDMNRNMSKIERSTKSVVDDTKSEMKDLGYNTRKSVLVSNWLDALKYGGTGAVLTSAILIAFYYVVV